jgi:HK97 family phage portal protein
MASLLDLFRRRGGALSVKGTGGGGLPEAITGGLYAANSYTRGFFQGVSRMFRQRNPEEYLEEYRGVVYACTQAICEEVANIDLRLYRGTGADRVEVTSHPVLDLLHDANSVMTYYDLWWATQANLELDGNAYWYLVRPEGGGAPQAIWMLRPDLVGIVPGQERWVDKYLYRNGGKTYGIDPDNILHFKTFNPLNQYKGVGTIFAAMASIDTQNAIKAWNQAWFDNGARPDTIIEYDGNLADTERKRLQREWDDQYKGATKAHRATFLGNKLKVTTLDVSQKDMDFVEQNRLTREEIMSIFRVPQSVLGITQDMTYANAETTNYVFSQRTIKPKMQRIMHTLNEFLLPMFGAEDLHFDFVDPVPENQEIKLSRFQNGLANGWLTPNEVRKIEGLPPVADGDSVRVPMGLAPGGSVLPEPLKVMAPTGKESLIKTIATAISKEAFPVFKSMQDFEERGKAWNAKQREAGDSAIKDVQKVMSEFFDEQSGRVTANLKDEMQKSAKRIKNKAINFDKVFDSEAEKQKLIEAITASMKTIVQAEGDSAMELTGSDVAFDANAKNVVAAIGKKVGKFAGEVTKTTSKAVRETIAAGVADNLSYSEIASSIKDLSEFSDTRSAMIARTEVVSAQTTADIEAWDQSGVVTQKTWYTALDERVCPDCMSLHGQTIDLKDQFEGMDDFIDGPPNHPNCRCSSLPVIEK